MLLLSIQEFFSCVLILAIKRSHVPSSSNVRAIVRVAFKVLMTKSWPLINSLIMVAESACSSLDEIEVKSE